MTKFKIIGAICVAVSLAAASPTFAAGMHGGFHGGGVHGGGAHFAGNGFRGGGYRDGAVGAGIAAGVIGSVIGSATYGYYGAPAYDDSYGYSDGYDNYDNRGANTFN